MSEFYPARVRAEWQDWSFGANQAAARAAAAEELIALRRQYTELSEPDLLRLAQSWRSDSLSGPYFTFTAADGSSLYLCHPEDREGAENGDAGNDDTPRDAAEPTAVVVDAVFVKALCHELADQTAAALVALLDQWSEQRRHAAYADLRTASAKPPRVALLLPRDDSRWPSASWERLPTLDLDAPSYDGAVLRWNTDSGLWLAPPSESVINYFRFGSGGRRT